MDEAGSRKIGDAYRLAHKRYTRGRALVKRRQRSLRDQDGHGAPAPKQLSR